MASRERPRIRLLDPGEIHIPDVRVTSYFDPETAELFKHSIEEVGIQQPILVAYDGEKYWLIDGLNRLEEAKLGNIPKVEAVVIKADLKSVLLKNLLLNVARGRVKPTEMLHVVNELYNKHGLSMDEIAKQSGLPRSQVEKLLAIAKCSPRIISALDDGLISVSHAYEISRVPNQEVQERLLGQAVTYRMSARDLRDIVGETLKIIEERAKQPEAKPSEAPPPISLAKCSLCEQEYPIKKVMGFNLCMYCYAIAEEAIKARLKELADKAEAERLKYAQALKEVTEKHGEG